MSEPRIIPAAEAQRLRENATPGPWAAGDSEYGHSDCPVTDANGHFIGSSPDDGVRAGFDNGDAQLIAAAPDLAHTVEQQDKVIETLSNLLAGAEEAAIERAEKIKNLLHALELIEWDRSGTLEWVIRSSELRREDIADEYR